MPRKISRRLRQPGQPLPTTRPFRALLQALSTAASEETLLTAFINDLLTEEEASELSKRFAAACLLKAKGSVRLVQKDVQLSKGTVERVKKWLEQENSGYRQVAFQVLPEPKEPVKKSDTRSQTPYYTAVLTKVFG